MLSSSTSQLAFSSTPSIHTNSLHPKMKFTSFSGLFAVALSATAAFAAPASNATALETRQGAEAAADVIGAVVDIAKAIIDQINQDKLVSSLGLVFFHSNIDDLPLL
jgi:arginine/lysine/ornithine decarboxylase